VGAQTFARPANGGSRGLRLARFGHNVPHKLAALAGKAGVSPAAKRTAAKATNSSANHPNQPATAVASPKNGVFEQRPFVFCNAMPPAPAAQSFAKDWGRCGIADFLLAQAETNDY
jgi:hypothetical protein